MCITTSQPDTKYNPNPNVNPNPTTKQHLIVSIRINIVTCPTYPENSLRDNVIELFILYILSVVTVPYPRMTGTRLSNWSR